MQNGLHIHEIFPRSSFFLFEPTENLLTLYVGRWPSTNLHEDVINLPCNLQTFVTFGRYIIAMQEFLRLLSGLRLSDVQIDAAWCRH